MSKRVIKRIDSDNNNNEHDIRYITSINHINGTILKQRIDLGPKNQIHPDFINFNDSDVYIIPFNNKIVLNQYMNHDHIHHNKLPPINHRSNTSNYSKNIADERFNDFKNINNETNNLNQLAPINLNEIILDLKHFKLPNINC